MHAYGRTDREAPTLLLLHGLTDSGRCWPDAVRRWQDGYRILAWEARGHGESDAPADEGSEPEAAAEPETAKAE